MKARKLAVVIFCAAVLMSLAQVAVAADAAETFKGKCAMCHGADGSKANPAMGVQPLSGADVQKQSDADLKTVISKGKGKMPAYAGKLSDAEIDGLVKYIRSLKK